VNTPQEVSMPRPTVAALFVVFVVLASLAGPAVAFADTLSGRVVDPDKRPVGGANVIVLRRGAVVATAKTTADGRFGPLTLADGEYEILTAAPGLRGETRITIAAGRPASVDVPLALSPVAESVVVSAAQVELPLTRVTDSVTVIDRADLDLHQTETAVDALRLVPGLSVVASGGRGGLTSIFPRGGESDYTLVLVDGIPMNAFGGSFDAAHLVTGDVDRIEVVRGPQSALYGGGAIGGIVHVVTRRGGPIGAQGLFEAGSQGTIRAVLSTTGSRRDWSWGAAIDGLNTDGNSRARGTLDGREVFGERYERTGGSANLSWSDRPSRRVGVTGGVLRSERGFPGPYGSDPAGLYEGLDLEAKGVSAVRFIGASASTTTGRLRHQGHVTWNRSEGDFHNQFGDSDDETARVTGRYQTDLDWRVGLSAGWELVRERVDNTFIVAGDDADKAPIKRSVSGWFVEARPSIGGRAFVNGGVRVERIARTALAADPVFNFPARPALGEDVVWSVNPKASVSWFARQPGERGWTRIRAGAGTGIKPPTGFDIAYTNNPSLKPERSRSFDIGVEQSFGASAFVADATWFANRYDDLIVGVRAAFAGASQYRTDNIANARSRGLEVGARWVGAGGFSVRAAWTYLDTEILGIDNFPAQAPPPFAVGGQLVRRPRQQGSIDASWSGARASAFFTVNGRGKMADLEPNFASTLVDNPGYATVAAGGSLRVTRGVEVYGRVTNLLDREYEDAFGFPALGRAGMVGIRVTGSR
jgi:outer membrane cobalamin receptor